MPNTLIREGYLDSDKVSALSDFDDRVFFRVLLAADDAGRTDGRVDKLRSALFPTRESVRSVDVERAVGRLIAAGLLTRWVWDGKPVVQVMRWQRRSGAQYSRYPGPDGSFRIEWTEVETRDGKQAFSTTSFRPPEGVVEPINNPSEGVSGKSPYTDTDTETNTESKTKTKKKKSADAASLLSLSFPSALDSDRFRSAWAEWVEARLSIGKPFTEAMAKKQLAKLAKYGIDIAVEAIDAAIAGGWQGVFPESIRPARGNANRGNSRSDYGDGGVDCDIDSPEYEKRFNAIFGEDAA